MEFTNNTTLVLLSWIAKIGKNSWLHFYIVYGIRNQKQYYKFKMEQMETNLTEHLHFYTFLTIYNTCYSKPNSMNLNFQKIWFILSGNSGLSFFTMIYILCSPEVTYFGNSGKPFWYQSKYLLILNSYLISKSCKWLWRLTLWLWKKFIIIVSLATISLFYVRYTTVYFFK